MQCLAAGSSILNRESESIHMRPLAKAVTKTIENVRNLLREQVICTAQTRDGVGPKVVVVSKDEFSSFDQDSWSRVENLDTTKQVNSFVLEVS